MRHLFLPTMPGSAVLVLHSISGVRCDRPRGSAGRSDPAPIDEKRRDQVGWPACIAVSQTTSPLPHHVSILRDDIQCHFPRWNVRLPNDRCQPPPETDGCILVRRGPDESCWFYSPCTLAGLL